MEKKSIVECVKRTYKITIGDMELRVESDKPLKTTTTAMLLKDDDHIKSFFDNCNILEIGAISETKEVIKNKDEKRSSIFRKSQKTRTRAKTRARRHIEKEVTPEVTEEEKDITEEVTPEVTEEEKEITEEVTPETIEEEKDITEEEEEKKEGQMTPLDRINRMLKIEGEFTRPDYQRMLEQDSQKMSAFMGHNDIEEAVRLRRIEPSGRSERFMKYRVIDQTPIDEHTYRNMQRTFNQRNKSAT